MLSLDSVSLLSNKGFEGLEQGFLGIVGRLTKSKDPSSAPILPLSIVTECVLLG